MYFIYAPVGANSPDEEFKRWITYIHQVPSLLSSRSGSSTAWNFRQPSKLRELMTFVFVDLHWLARTLVKFDVSLRRDHCVRRPGVLDKVLYREAPPRGPTPCRRNDITPTERRVGRRGITTDSQSIFSLLPAWRKMHRYYCKQMHRADQIICDVTRKNGIKDHERN